MRRVIVIFTITIFLGCDQLTSPLSSPLIGSWFAENSYSVVVPNQSDTLDIVSFLLITFESNQTMRTTRKDLDASTGQLLGYRFASRGRYSTRLNNLTMITEASASSEDYSQEELTPRPVAPESLTVRFAVNEDRLKWVFPPCPPNAYCISQAVFLRSKQ